jgi:regulator of ribonuclease activity A
LTPPGKIGLSRKHFPHGARLVKPTCDLYDEFLETIGVLPAGLAHFGGRESFHGPAVTVKCFEDNSRIKELAGQPGASRVMIVDAGGSLRCAVLGDVIAGEAVANGWAGIIIWGAVRDRRALAELDLGVMAIGGIPRKSTRRGEGQTDMAITLGNTAIEPGDLIVADADGVLVFPGKGPQPNLA